MRVGADDGWNDYRARRAVWLLAFGSFVPINLSAVPLLLKAGFWPAAAGAAFGSFALVGVAEIGLRTFHCPGCGELYFVRGWIPFHWFPCGRCRWCGLRKWQNPDVRANQ